MKSDLEWKQWGRLDPLYGVAAWQGRHRAGPNPWTDEEFYALGANDWSAFHAHWQRYGLDPAHCLEIGCGAGRITKHLSSSFHRVIALDVSADMIAYAQRHVPDSVEFICVGGGALPLAAASVTAVFSCHVFQHFDSEEDIADAFAEVHRVLLPGGTVMIHVPMHRWPRSPRVFGAIYRWQQRLARWRAEVRRGWIRRGKWRPLMRYQSVDWPTLLAQLTYMGFTDVDIQVFAVQSNGDPHSFVLARKC